MWWMGLGLLLPTCCTMLAGVTWTPPRHTSVTAGCTLAQLKRACAHAMTCLGVFTCCNLRTMLTLRAAPRRSVHSVHVVQP